MCCCLASPGTCLVRCGRRHEAWSKRHINYCHRLASTHWKEEMQKCGLSTEPQRKGSFEPTPFKREHSELFICLLVAPTTPEFRQSLFCCGDRPLTIAHTCTATWSQSQGTFGNILLHQRPALLHDIRGDCLMTKVPTHST